MTIHYLQPAAQALLPPEPYRLSLNMKIETVTLGLVANGFAGSERFLDHLAGALVEFIPTINIQRYLKPDPTSKAPEAMRQAIESACDGVIAAYGHCGSCTSATIRDTIMFARSGLPSVALVTDKFFAEAEFISKASGMPGIPMISLPHPIAGTGDASMEALAREVTPVITKNLASAS